MDFFNRLSLRKKISAGILLTVFLVQIVGFSVSFYSDMESIRAEVLAEKRLTAKIVSGYTVTDLLFENKGSALESLAYLKRDHSIINAYLFEKKNEVFVSLYESQFDNLVEEYDYGVPWHHYSEGELHVFEPVFSQNQQIGALYLRTSTARHDERIIERLVYFLILLCILTFVAIVIAGFLSKVITSPILYLADLAKKITLGKKYDLNFKFENKDETGQLFLAFKEMLVQIKKRDDLQSEILNSMVDGVITIDEEGLVLSFNHSAEKMFGYSSEEIVGFNITKLMEGFHASKHNNYLDRYLASDDDLTKGLGLEVDGVKKDKEVFPLRISVAELQKSEQGKRRFIGTCQDLTLIRQQEEQIRRTQKMDALGKLTGGIAHDFNNMLGAVLGYAELLSDSLVGQPKLIRYVKQIQHAGERGSKLTKRLLSFTSKQSLELARVNVNTLLLEQQDMLQKTLTVRIKLNLELEAKVWPIWIDSNDLEDAIINMSINAMHAMPAGEVGAELTIKTCNQSLGTLDALMIGLESGDYVQLSLTDTGNGMSKALADKIFDPFFTTKGEKGTGLGLSQVIGFVKRVSGTIKVYSELGLGSQFVLYFPRHFTGDEKHQIERNKNSSNIEGHEKILVVDDEKPLRVLASELLTLKGYKTTIAESGKKALEILEKQEFDLLITDVIMPDMDGYQLSHIVKEKYPHIKIQLASGFTDERNKNKADEHLQKNLLHKPYNTQDLYRAVRGLLDKTVSSDLLTEESDQSQAEKPKCNGTKNIHWTESMSVGVEDIDSDHKKWLSFLNACIEFDQNNGSYRDFSALLDNLIMYTKEHFVHEEQYMEKFDYPLLNKHKKVHEILLNEVVNYKSKLETGDKTIDQFLTFLGAWLVEHISVMDKKTVNYCKIQDEEKAKDENNLKDGPKEDSLCR